VIEIPYLHLKTTKGGTTKPKPGSYWFETCEMFTIEAVPDAGYEFDYWLFQEVARIYERIVEDHMAYEDKIYEAYFRPVVVPEYTLTITVTVGGTTDPSPGSYIYPSETTVTVRSIPDKGYRLVRWELNGIDMGNPPSIDVTMDKDHHLHTVYEPIPPLPKRVLAVGPIGLGLLLMLLGAKKRVKS